LTTDPRLPPRHPGPPPAKTARRLRALQFSLGSTALGTILAIGGIAEAQVTVEPIDTPRSLKTVPRPEPSNLGEFVQNKTEAIALGKALFWDMQLGSDGKTACASCHFQAGADSRGKNQLSPGLNRMASLTSPNPDTTFQLGGVNYQFKLHDFPLHRLSDPNNRHSTVVRSVNDVAASQGVFLERFSGISSTVALLPTMPVPLFGFVARDPYSTWFASTTEQRTLVPDPLFTASGVNTRRVEPRNSPTVINAVFNFRNFWDGRAEHVFNGVNPFGQRDPNARVYRNVQAGLQWSMQPTQVRMNNASLASQASGPPLSHFEMSAEGRGFADIGRKMLYLRPLQHQQVNLTDSVLGWRRHISGNGLSEPNYASMVQKAFRPEWWNGSNLVQVNADGSKTLVPMSASPAANQYTHMQQNFSLFFGLALQLYQATLVSDDAPFDRWAAGATTAMSTSAQQGFGLFMGKGRCVNCHGGAEFTNASVRKMLATPMARMVMGNGGTAVYDEGFYNIGVRPTLDDLGLGAKDPFGNPLAMSALAQISNTRVRELVGINPNLTVSPGERIAINGQFKTPTLRNVELTGPYFHNGDSATLHQVVEFYNRGGNFPDQNLPDLDADITPLGLTETEKTALVDFMLALTDHRVRYAKAPFDHPQLFIPNGHDVASNGVVIEAGRAKDSMVEIPAVGAAGRATPLPNFLNTTNTGFQLVAAHSGKCVDVLGRGTNDGTAIVQWACNGQANQKWEQVPANGGFLVRSVDSGKCLDVSEISYAQGARMWLWNCHGGDNQVFNWVGNELKVKHSGQCLNVNGASHADGTTMIQWPCTPGATNDNFTKR
jgi:cytochrome c peroxidase